eukprot:Hpha_TRINITY_DN26788_c0_g1::TRINITY_DN26788_c0_g1_i1::g.138865::m.138865
MGTARRGCCATASAAAVAPCRSAMTASVRPAPVGSGALRRRAGTEPLPALITGRARRVCQSSSCFVSLSRSAARLQSVSASAHNDEARAAAAVRRFERRRFRSPLTDGLRRRLSTEGLRPCKGTGISPTCPSWHGDTFCATERCVPFSFSYLCSAAAAAAAAGAADGFLGPGDALLAREGQRDCTVSLAWGAECGRDWAIFCKASTWATIRCSRLCGTIRRIDTTGWGAAGGCRPARAAVQPHPATRVPEATAMASLPQAAPARNKVWAGAVQTRRRSGPAAATFTSRAPLTLARGAWRATTESHTFVRVFPGIPVRWGMRKEDAIPRPLSCLISLRSIKYRN